MYTACLVRLWVSCLEISRIRCCTFVLSLQTKHFNANTLSMYISKSLYTYIYYISLFQNKNSLCCILLRILYECFLSTHGTAVIYWGRSCLVLSPLSSTSIILQSICYNPQPPRIFFGYLTPCRLRHSASKVSYLHLAHPSAAEVVHLLSVLSFQINEI